MSDHLENSGPVWLIGAGGMAVEYVRVLLHLGVTPVVVGRGATSAARFTSKTGVPVITGGLESYLATDPPPPSMVIVAVNVVNLARVARAVLDFAQPRMLIEKPGFLSREEADLVRQGMTTAEVFIGYNRRFYAAATAAQAMLDEDGGPVSCLFEFTEWAHRIEMVRDSKNPRELANWVLANSSHVIDLAFHLAGHPARMDCVTAGSLSWHPSASAFAGSGLTDRGATFSYHANWAAPGRWRVEVMSAARRFLLCPLETLQVQEKGRTDWRAHELDDAADRDFKPGVLRMVEAFLKGADRRLCGAAEQALRLSTYQRIAGLTHVGGGCAAASGGRPTGGDAA